MNRSERLRREQFVSGAINFVLSAAFFVAVFGLGEEPLPLAGLGGFALDFLPQAGAIALMSSLVPLLLVTAALRRAGEGTPGRAFLVQTVGLVVLWGLASGAVLAALCLIGPWPAIGWTFALAIKLLYGTLLGVAGTRFALHRLFGHAKEKRA